MWWQKLSVVGTFVIEIMVPPLFFSPFRRLRLGAFYMQVGLRLLFTDERAFFFIPPTLAINWKIGKPAVSYPGVNHRPCFFVLFMTGSASGAHYLDGKLQLLQPVDAGALPVASGRSACKLLVKEACWAQEKRW